MGIRGWWRLPIGSCVLGVVIAMVIEQAFFFRSAPFSFQDWGASSRFNFLAQSIFEFFREQPCQRLRCLGRKYTKSIIASLFVAWQSKDLQQ